MQAIARYFEQNVSHTSDSCHQPNKVQAQWPLLCPRTRNGTEACEINTLKTRQHKINALALTE